jgi:hypothetical protein
MTTRTTDRTEPVLMIARRLSMPLPDDVRMALSIACERDTRPPAYEAEVLLRRALIAEGLLPLDETPAETIDETAVG